MTTHTHPEVASEGWKASRTERKKESTGRMGSAPG